MYCDRGEDYQTEEANNKKGGEKRKKPTIKSGNKSGKT